MRTNIKNIYHLRAYLRKKKDIVGLINSHYVNQRGLPSNYPNKVETLWEVVKPFKMEGGIAQPWKDAKGLGVQYKMKMTIQELWDKGYIKPRVQQ